MQAAAILSSSSLNATSSNTFNSGSPDPLEIGIVVTYTGDNAGVSGYVHDQYLGAESIVRFNPTFITSGPFASNYSSPSHAMASYVAIGAMAGYVDSRTGIGVDHHIDPNLKGGDGCKIFAFDTSKFFTAGGLKTKTTSIRIEADVRDRKSVV